MLPAATVVAQNKEHDVMSTAFAMSLSMTVLPAMNAACFGQDSALEVGSCHGKKK